MEQKPLGRTGFQVSRLGAGLSEIGYRLTLAETQTAASVLNQALDSGINFLDTSACYNISEELIGRTVSHRRHEYFLATKCGHATGDWTGPDWTAATVTHSIDRSLRRLQTDVLDLVQLHSCGLDVLQQGEVITALQQARDAGKVRYIGYSGDNEAAMWAVNSGLFDTLQTSFNLVEQKARYGLLAAAKAQNMGIIIKRPIANAAWGVSSSPSGYATTYFHRAQTMLADGPLPDAPANRIWLALGFVMAHPEVDTAILGTHNPRHMAANVAMLANERPFPTTTLHELYRRFDRHGQNWQQLT